MTSLQRNLFEGSTGFDPAALLELIAGISAVVFLTWGANLTFKQFQRFQEGQASWYEFSVTAVRALVVMLLLGYLLR